MNSRRNASPWALVVTFALCSSVVGAQEAATTSAARQQTTGTVVSVSPNTLVVRSDDSQFHLFVFDSYTQKPRSIGTGSTVRVDSMPGHEPGVRLAELVTVVQPAPAPTKPAPGQTAPATPDVVPKEVRALENDLKRQVSRFGVGFRIGTALDPELFLLGVQARIGPIFTRDLWFRPNLELGFGEVTSMVGINLEVVYRLPVTARGSKWSTYFGAGPAFNFTNQSFDREDADTSIHFGDFDYKTGFNILMGMQHRKGPFFEVKTAIYSTPAPVLRLVGGYTF